MNGGGLDVVIVSYRSRELLRGCLDSLRAHPPSCPMSGRRRRQRLGRRHAPRWSRVELSRGRSDRLAREPRLRRGHQPRGASRRVAVPARPQPGHGGDRRARSTRCSPCSRRTRRSAVVGPRLRARRRLARPRREALLPHSAERARPLHAASAGDRDADGALAAYRAPEVESGPVDAVNGAFMLMRRSAFEAAGGFDEGYWMYMEDLDLSYRLAQAGWLSWYEPAATVMHVKGGHRRRPAAAAAQLALPPRHVPLLPPALRAAALAAR